MILERARELLQNHGCSRNAAALVLVEVRREHGQQAVATLIHERKMTEVFGFTPGQTLKTPGS